MVEARQRETLATCPYCDSRIGLDDAPVVAIVSGDTTARGYTCPICDERFVFIDGEAVAYEG